MSMTNEHQEIDTSLRIEEFFQTPIEGEVHRITPRLEITERGCTKLRTAFEIVCILLISVDTYSSYNEGCSR